MKVAALTVTVQRAATAAALVVVTVAAELIAAP
jgi:hypothetical protein